MVRYGVVSGEGATMSQPYSDRVGCSFLWGYFLCPALMVVIAIIVGEPPNAYEIDWAGASLPARLINFGFSANLVESY
jgi:hypothetical protein